MPHRVPSLDKITTKATAQVSKTSEESNKTQDTPGIFGAPAQTEKTRTNASVLPPRKQANQSTEVEASVNNSQVPNSIVKEAPSAKKEPAIFLPTQTHIAKTCVDNPQRPNNTAKQESLVYYKRKRNEIEAELHQAQNIIWKSKSGDTGEIRKRTAADHRSTRRDATARCRARKEAVIKQMQEAISCYREELGLPQIDVTKKRQSKKGSKRPHYAPPPEQMATMNSEELSAWRAKERRERRNIANKEAKQKQDQLITDLNKQMKELEERVKLQRENNLDDSTAKSTQTSSQECCVPIAKSTEQNQIVKSVSSAKQAGTTIHFTPTVKSAESSYAHNKSLRYAPIMIETNRVKPMLLTNTAMTLAEAAKLVTIKNGGLVATPVKSDRQSEAKLVVDKDPFISGTNPVHFVSIKPESTALTSESVEMAKILLSLHQGS